MTDLKSISEYKRRRIQRLRARFDDDDDENNGGSAKRGGHGNTKIPFGLCQREGIKVGADWTPKDAWNALEGKGYSASETYSELKKTGKTPKSPTGKATAGAIDLEAARSDFSSKRDKLSQLQAELRKHPDRAELDGKIEALKSRLEDHEKNVRLCRTRVKRFEKRFGMTRGELEEAARQGKFLQWEERGKMWGRSAQDFLKDYHNLDYWEHALSARKRDLEGAQKKRDEVVGPLEEQVKQAKKEARDAAKKAFPTFDDCKNVEEVEARLDAEVLFKGEARPDFGDLELEHGKRLAKSATTFFDKHPDLRGKLNAFRVVYEDSGTMGASNEREVLFNSKYFGNDMFEERYKKTVESGFHPEGTTAMSVVAHEYTHQLDSYMSEALGMKRTKFSDKVMQEVAEEIRTLTEEEIRKSVSDYAMKKYADGENQEFLAEAYSEYLTSPNPRRIAMATGRIVEKYLKQVQKGTEVTK